jgi:hypothetical protein
VAHVAGGESMRGRHGESRVGLSGYVTARNDSPHDLNRYHRFVLVTAIWPASGLSLPDTPNLIQLGAGM